MKLFIYAVPVFDATMTVQCYRLSVRSGDNILDIQHGHNRMMGALQSPGLDLVEKVGLEAFTNDNSLFVEINQYQLLTGKPADMNINPEKLICVLPGGIAAEEAVIERCKTLKRMGYRLALDDFPLNGMQSPFFEHIEFLFLNVKNRRFPDIFKSLQKKRVRFTIVLTNIDDMEQFNQLKTNHNCLFAGDFYSEPITAGQTGMAPVKVNALQLMKQVNEPDFELEDIVKIIERDPALSISLMRFINSFPREHSITSIQGAVAMMGQEEIRQWASAAISIDLSQDRPGEITRLSLLRARFAENLAGAFELGVHTQQLFMAGLFSLLDVILQLPMDEALSEVAASSKVRQALVEKSGDLHPVLQLIHSYERTDWDEVSRLIIHNDVPLEAVNAALMEALTWYDQLVVSLNTPPGPDEMPVQ